MRKIPTLILLCLALVLNACNNKDEKPADIKTSDSTAGKTTTAEISYNPYAGVDISSMDMSYCPADYPKLKMVDSISTPPLARVIYSRPHLGGRRLFQNLLKYGEPWRLGANESTEITLYKDAIIQNAIIKAGRYVLYAIPRPDKWTIVFNSNTDSWGLEPDSTKDIKRFDIPVRQTSSRLEYFTIVFEPGNVLLMAWDTFEARLPINFD